MKDIIKITRHEVCDIIRCLDSYSTIKRLKFLKQEGLSERMSKLLKEKLEDDGV